MAPARHFARAAIRLPSSNSPATHVQSPDPNVIGWDQRPVLRARPPVMDSDQFSRGGHYRRQEAIPGQGGSGRGSLLADTAGQNLPAAMSARLTRVTT